MENEKEMDTFEKPRPNSTSPKFGIEGAYTETEEDKKVTRNSTPDELLSSEDKDQYNIN